MSFVKRGEITSWTCLQRNNANFIATISIHVVWTMYIAPIIRGWVTTKRCQDIFSCFNFSFHNFIWRMEMNLTDQSDKKYNKQLNSKELFRLLNLRSAICICFYAHISVICAAFITSAWFHHQIKALPY